jgi:hypothetical protein
LLVTVVTVLVTVPVALLTVDPAPLGRCLVTVFTAPLSADPAVETTLWTVVEIGPVLGPGEETQPLEHPEVVGGVPGFPEGETGVCVVPEDCSVLPPCPEAPPECLPAGPPKPVVRRACPPRRAAPPEAPARGASTALCSARDAGEPPWGVAPESETAAVDGAPPTWGQPWNATNALASKKIRAAPASRDPEVPKPARYARGARTVIRIGN